MAKPNKARLSISKEPKSAKTCMPPGKLKARNQVKIKEPQERIQRNKGRACRIGHLHNWQGNSILSYLLCCKTTIINPLISMSFGGPPQMEFPIPHPYMGGLVQSPFGKYKGVLIRRH
jgi:uncharacterized protein (DUF3820 family)